MTNWYDEQIAFCYRTINRLEEHKAEILEHLAELHKIRTTCEAIEDMCHVCPGPPKNTVVCPGCTKGE